MFSARSLCECRLLEVHLYGLVENIKFLGFRNFIFRDLLGFIGWDIGPSKGHFLQTINKTIEIEANGSMSDNTFVAHIIWVLYFQLQRRQLIFNHTFVIPL